MKLHIDGTDYADGGNLVSGEGLSPYWIFDEDAQDYVGPSWRWRWMARLYRIIVYKSPDMTHRERVWCFITWVMLVAAIGPHTLTWLCKRLLGEKP